MALARGKTKNEATVCECVTVTVTLCDPASSSGASFFAWLRGERETRVTGDIFIGIPSGSLCGVERAGGRLRQLRGHPDHVLIFFRHI